MAPRPARRSAVALALATALLVAAGCSGSGGSDEATRTPSSSRSTTTTRPATDGVLVIGQLAPVTGPVAAIADSFTVPVKLALDEINFGGGVGGKEVQLVVADDGSDRGTGRTAYQSLVDGHADVIVGPSSSDLAAELVPDLAADRVVMCSGSNTVGLLRQVARDGWYFRTAPGDQLQARALAALVDADGHRRPLVLGTDDDYADPFTADIVRAMRARGLEPRRRLLTAADAAAAPRSFAAGTDAVVYVGFPDGVAPILRAMATAGHGPLDVASYGTDGLQNADLAGLVDPASPAVVAGLTGTTAAGVPAGRLHPFDARLNQAGVEPFFSASTYDCTILLALAAVAAGTDDAGAIRRALPKLLTGRRRCTGFVECRDLLRAGRTIDYQGAFSDYERYRGTEPGTGVFDRYRLGLDGRPMLGAPEEQITVPTPGRG